MTTAAAQPSTDEAFIRFPPFPPPPPGVKVTPFNQYKETGIKLTCPNPDGIEVDGLDIPTVILARSHATDRCKTDAWRDESDGPDGPKAKKKRKSKKSTSILTASGEQEWWQIWQDEEPGKFTGPYNPKIPAIDRLCRAASDFRSSRSWPQPDPRQLSATKLFNQFGVFIGLEAIVPVWVRAERRKAEEAMKQFKDAIEREGQNANPNEDEDESEDDLLEPDDAPDEVIIQDTQEDPIMDTRTQDETLQDEAETAALQQEDERKEDRLLAFLNDPETVTKMFLSSYMRKEGLVWADSNLSITPRVLFFFFRYILRNKLLSEYDAGLKKALSVVERAQIELPRTSVIAKIVPCEVSLALRDQFGSKAEQFKLPLIDGDGNEDKNNADEADDSDMDDAVLEEHTVEYVGDGEFVDVLRPVEGGIASIEEIKEESKTTANADDGTGWGNVKVDVDTNAEWGTSGGAWETADGKWGETFGYEEPTTNPIDWTLPSYSLNKFLGMNVLPPPYTTGVVEESVRKIISVHAPANKGGKAKTSSLEDDFVSKLGRIVLAPWNDWDVPKEGEQLDEIRRVYSEISKGRRVSKGITRRGQNLEGGQDPQQVLEEKEANEEAENIGEGEKNESEKPFNPEELYDDGGQEYTESARAKIVWETSRGWVVDPTSGEVVFADRAAGGRPSATKKPPAMNVVHDPLRDLVEIIVDPAVIEKVKDVVGLGFGGTFIQLVKENEGQGGGFWYLEDLKLVIASFYTS